MLVEKILEPGEVLPASWATAGTTGYDALGRARPGAHRPGRRRRRWTRWRPGCAAAPVDWPALIHDTKRAVADGILRSEVQRLVPRAAVAPARRTRDRAEDAVAELLACFPVYRSYLPEGREHLDAGVRPRARRTGPTWPRRSTRSQPVLADPDAAAARCGSSRPPAW